MEFIYLKNLVRILLKIIKREVKAKVNGINSLPVVVGNTVMVSIQVTYY